MAGTDLEIALGEFEKTITSETITIPDAEKKDVYAALGRIQQAAKSVSDLEQATFLVTALSGVSEHATQAGLAFFKKKPPNMEEGGAEVFRMVGSLAQLLTYAGKWGGPVGLIVGELFSIGATLLGAFAPKQETVGEQLKKELREFSGTDIALTMHGVLDAFHDQRADLENMTANRHRWDELLPSHSLAGDSLSASIGKTQGWLMENDHQTLRAWPLVFDSYLLAVQQYLTNFTLAYRALKRMDQHGVTLDTAHAKEDIKRAHGVLGELRKRYEFVISNIGPLALNHGTVWHIGTSEKVYKRETVVSDASWTSLGGASTRLSVGTDERIWTIGNGNRVWTGKGAEEHWKKTSITAEDIWVVKQDVAFSGGQESLSDVYTIEHGKLCWRIWDEAAKEDAKLPEPARWEKFIQIPGIEREAIKKYSGDDPWGGVSFQHVVAAGNGTAYLLGKSATGGNPLRVWYKSVGHVRYVFELFVGPEPGEVDYKGIAVNKDNIYIFTKNKIYFCPHSALKHPNWKPIAGPVRNDENWSYDQLFASDDGSLLVTIQKKIYLWDGEQWIKNRDKDSAVRVCKIPVRGWENYGAVADLVKSLGSSPSVPVISAG